MREGELEDIKRRSGEVKPWRKKRMKRRRERKNLKQKHGLDVSVLEEGKAWLKYEKTAFEAGRLNVIQINSKQVQK